MLDVRLLTLENLPDLQELFGSERWAKFLLVHVVHHRRQGVSSGRFTGECCEVQGTCDELCPSARTDWLRRRPAGGLGRSRATITLCAGGPDADDEGRRPVQERRCLARSLFLHPSRDARARDCAKTARRRRRAGQGIERLGHRRFPDGGFQTRQRRPSGRHRAFVRVVRLQGHRPSFVEPRYHASRFVCLLICGQGRGNPRSRSKIALDFDVASNPTLHGGSASKSRHAMLRIGDFSRIARVSGRLLRYYDSIGLLSPRRIDPRRATAITPRIS